MIIILQDILLFSSRVESLSRTPVIMTVMDVHSISLSAPISVEVRW